MSEITITIDGKACKARPGLTIAEAAKANGIYIPTLCHYEGLKPVGSCRVCTVRVGGRYMAACTQIAVEWMAVENTAPDLEDMRRSILEMLFVEFNKSPINDIKKFTKPVDVGIIEGGYCNSENVEVLRSFRKNCKILVSLGECAIMGGLRPCATASPSGSAWRRPT